MSVISQILQHYYILLKKNHPKDELEPGARILMDIPGDPHEPITLILNTGELIKILEPM